MNTISKKLASNDLKNKILEKIYLYKLIIASIIIINIGATIGLIIQASLITLIIFAWQYHKDLKEINRLEKTYGI